MCERQIHRQMNKQIERGRERQDRETNIQVDRKRGVRERYIRVDKKRETFRLTERESERDRDNQTGKERMEPSYNTNKWS